ncbi:MAG: VPS10 domain-containing protein [Thermoanaerobaculia bacterium]
MVLILLVATVLIAAPAEREADAEKPGALAAGTFSGLTLRSIGPAVASGRVSDIAVHPARKSTYYVAVASGGIFKTVNSGTTWTPVFDNEGSFSIGCLAIDPKDPLVVWAGTGENNSQRSVAYGDGVYKSTDGGKSWQNVGLKSSEHIGKIVIDPRNSDVVWVAAQGPLWSPGGDRGLYKTTDGGRTWKRVLSISENTGVSDVVLDPRNPDVAYAASYQRRRHVWTLIDGGPESAIHKTRDGGATWTKVSKGLPEEDLGRIGLEISPADPNILYAIVEAANKKSGFFRSTDGAASWERRSDYVSTSPQYYQEIIADPKNPDRVYSMDTWMHVTDDGGKTFRKVGEDAKHVDNHSLWIDPADTNYLLAGCDGGVYESFDRGATWNYKSNLPIMQFYKVAVDNAKPFYNVYGGTQDNNTLGGPSRTISDSGIVNSDWFVTTGGDGFQTRVDPEDPNIVYSQSQHGYLVRYDRRTGETIDIKPREAKGEEGLRWNWDSPLIISPHSHTRLYFASNRLYRSDDRGDTWKAVSPDLTRGIDRNKLKVMGKVWPIEAVAKNASTSFYGNVVALSESPLEEGLLYVGTDDGAIQVSEDGGANWRKLEKFPGVPDMAYVSRLEASQHEADVVYAAFDNHKMGDFKPYVLRSADRGRTWVSVSGDLPQRGTVYALVEDHVKRDLLFAGTEFGVYFTLDGGKKWIQLKGGMPVIQVRDLAIQKRENDLVVATFGRGFYILDDYTPLRAVTPELLKSEATLFPADRTAWMFIPSTPLGGRGKAFQGDAYYTAPNPEFGAVFTYYLRDELKAKQKTRREQQAKLDKEGKEVSYPAWDALLAESREEEPAIVVTIADEEGNVVRRMSAPAKAGFHRIAWDLRYPAATPTELKPEPPGPFDVPPRGPLAAPGRYTVSIAKLVDGAMTPLSSPRSFNTAPLGTASLPAKNNAALLEFQKKTARLQRAVLGAVRLIGETQTRIDHIRKALVETPGADATLANRARALDMKLKDLKQELQGDAIRSRYNEPTPPSIVDRVQGVVEGHWASMSEVTNTHRDDYSIAAEEFGPFLAKLTQLVEVDLKQLEESMEKAGAPWTPGRVPRWTNE